MSGSGREALPNFREWSSGPPGRPGVVGRPCRMSGSGGKSSRMSKRLRRCPGVVRRPSQMFGSGWETLPEVQEALSNVREWSEALQDIREWSRDSPGFPGVVKWPSQMSGSGRASLPNV